MTHGNGLEGAGSACRIARRRSDREVGVGAVHRRHGGRRARGPAGDTAPAPVHRGGRAAIEPDQWHRRRPRRLSVDSDQRRSGSPRRRRLPHLARRAGAARQLRLVGERGCTQPGVVRHAPGRPRRPRCRTPALPLLQPRQHAGDGERRCLVGGIHAGWRDLVRHRRWRPLPHRRRWQGGRPLHAASRRPAQPPARRRRPARGRARRHVVGRHAGRRRALDRARLRARARVRLEFIGGERPHHRA